MGAALGDSSGLRAQKAVFTAPGGPSRVVAPGKSDDGACHPPTPVFSTRVRPDVPRVTGPILKPSRPDIEEKGGPGRQRGHRRGPEQPKGRRGGTENSRNVVGVVEGS